MITKLVTSPHVRHPGVLQADFEPDQSSMVTFIPIGLLSLVASSRESLGYEPKLFDLNRRIVDGTIAVGPGFYELAADMICADGPDLVGFMTESDSYHHVLQICAEIRKIRPSSVIVLGGPHASSVASRTLEKLPYVDFVVQGEGEITFTELVQACMRREQQPIPGLWYRDSSGDVKFGGSRAQISNLDELPFPAYDLYQPDIGEEIFLEVGRGCPFRCSFCSTAPFWKRQHRVKSPRRILAEIDRVVFEYGPRRLHFTHDLFTTDREWVRKLCEVLIEHGSRVRWTCSSRTDTVNGDLLELMAKAGCDSIYFGLESGSERILKKIDKTIDIEESFRILRACQDVGITPNAGFIGGLPSEDKQSLEMTFTAYSRALQMGCNPAHIFLYTPYADSSAFSSLGETVCTGHFVDLPLGYDLDVANRELIVSDSELYCSYHRPKHSDELRATFDCLEEFPTLVTSAMLPALHIAEAMGGMFRLFEKWTHWIGDVNLTRGAASYRRYYGSPVQFCDFLLHQVSLLSHIPAHLTSVLRVLRVNHSLAGAGRLATTMANYRTELASNEMPIIKLDTQLTLGDVLACMQLDHDVSLAFASPLVRCLPDPLPGPLHLLWHRDAFGAIRLLGVDAFTFRAIELLMAKPRVAAEVLADWTEQSRSENILDFFDLLVSLGEAAQSGIIVEPTSPSSATACASA